MKTRSITAGAAVAAAYAALTVLLAPLSFGAVQFRLAEALCALPLLTAESVPALAVGCFVANLLGGAPLPDVVCGTFATLLAAFLTRRARKKPCLALGAPALCNGLIVGPTVYFCYVMGEGTFSLAALGVTCLTVTAGELAVCYTAGLGLFQLLKRMPRFRKRA